MSIRLKPNAKRDLVTPGDGTTPLQIAVTSPPVENRANDHCIVLLAKRLGVPKSGLHLIKGGHSRNKVIAVDGLTQEQALLKLSVDS